MLLSWFGSSAVLLLFGLSDASPLRAEGRPLLRFYEAPGHPQYWAVAQDSRGVLGFGTGDGLLEYDGESWRLSPLPTESAVRSLAAAPDGKLYVGGQSDFGYFELLPEGERRFVSLRGRAAPGDLGFQDVWKTYVTGSGVFFQAYDRIFRWRDGELRAWQPTPGATFHFSFVARETLYVLDRSAGLLRLEGDVWAPLPGGERFASDRLYALLDLPTGLLFGFREHGLLLYRDGEFSPFAPEVQPYLAAHRLYHAALLPDGGIALGTLTGGLVVLAPDGRLRQTIDRGMGLASDKVSFVFVDREGAVWLAQDGGAARVDVVAPFVIYGSPATRGMVLSLETAGERLFVGTSAGLSVADTGEEPFALRPVEGVEAAVFDLLALDDGVLAATNEGTYLVSGTGTTRLSDGIANALARSPSDPGRLYVGQIDGVRLLRRAGGRWQDAGMLPGVDTDVRCLLESGGGLWIGTKTRGLLRAEPTAAGAWSVTAAGGEAVQRGAVDVRRLGGGPVFLSVRGVERIDERTGRFERERWMELEPELAHRRLTFLYDDETDHRLWVVSRPGDSRTGPNYAVHVFATEPSPRPSPLGREVRRLGDRTITTVHVAASGVWLGSRDELVRFDPRRARTPGASDVPPPICRVRVAGGDGARMQLRSGSGSVRIACALPSFVDERSNEYRFRLLGTEDDWSEWSRDGGRVLSQLRAGRHELAVQARDALGGESDPLAIPLAVAPRWHELGLVRVGALLALLLGIWAAVAARLATLRTRQRQLEAIVAARTRELRTSETQFRRLFDNASDIIFATDLDGTIRSISPAVERVLGYAPDELRGRPLHELVAAEERSRLAGFLAAAASGPTDILELAAAGKDGRARVLQLTAQPLMPSEGSAALEGIARDVTERRGLEEQVRQAQKMEAIGQLAGGVAHDFNNLLTVIMGNCELLQEDSDVVVRAGLTEIHKAARDAASLTRQLLAFSRRQLLRPEVIRLNDVVEQLGPMFRRLIGETIVQRYDLAPDLWATRADTGQVGQVLMNLVVNARDAMPQGGALVIATRNATLADEETAASLELPLGEYVMLSVADSGHGMDAETVRRAFEPFFTTKEQGRGTGLGLSTVFGIVKQTGGAIAVASTPGQGTTFSIYLPRVVEPAGDVVAPEEGLTPSSAPRAAVLVVEDEPAIRNLLQKVLGNAGYDVGVAADGREALARASERRFDLLISDVVMPELQGPDVARCLRRLQPELRVLFMTGYATPSTADPLVKFEEVLSKPFSSSKLLATVREVLARPREPARDPELA